MMRYQCDEEPGESAMSAASSASKMLRQPSSAGTTAAAVARRGKGRVEFRRERIVQLRRGSGGDVAHPGSDRERGPPRLAAGVEVAADRAQQPQPDLLRSVAAHLGRGVAQGGIREPAEHLGAVLCPVQALRAG